MGKILSLNLLFNYPVRWDEYRILRDFVQNFYDAKSCDRWRSAFSYEYEDKRLTMVMDGVGFAYDWILHIGASSKTSDSHSAGYFGEGFKIAALCAVRDYDWDVTMSSRDWAAHVIGQDISLDGTSQKELAYEISERPEVNKSILVLNGVKEKQFTIFESVLLSFYYPENPLFGKRLFEDDIVAVYTRSDTETAPELPETYEFGKKGAVFVRYQMMGTLPFPCVVALHPYEQRDRERKILYSHDVLKVLYNVAMRIDAHTAAYLLEQMPDKWNSYPHVLVDSKSWYYIVCQLIRTISESGDESAAFREKYPNLLFTRRFISGNTSAENRRRQARAWIKIQPINYKIVMEQFKLLGYPELEELCEDAGGFADTSAPTEIESRYLNILDEICKNVFEGFFPENKNIVQKVIRLDNSAWCGKAEIIKAKGKHKNIAGLQIRSELSCISIKDEYLIRDRFSKALSVYLHEKAHVFGGDNTQNFSLALTYIAEILIENRKTIDHYQEKWLKIHDD